MKANQWQYLPLRNVDTVTTALNFSTPDCHVIGGCDVYTTKAAGGDKKLYKNIENNLESQYESLARLSNSLSPPYQGPRSTASDDGKGSEKDGQSAGSKRYRSVGIPDVDLARASPFGPLSQITARRTFAYLIATLNASHPDYDFSHTLRPVDFKKERNLGRIMAKIDNTMQNLRPRPQGYQGTSYLSPPSTHPHSAPFISNVNSDVWSSKMWSLIDKEMGLKTCEKYSYVPEADIFAGEENSLWSMHYFFFNKEKKRVCYFYLRALSVISHSPVSQPSYTNNRSRHKHGQSHRRRSNVTVGEGAHKRASYWLGPLQNGDVETLGYEDDDDEIIDEPNDDEVEVPYMDLDDIRSNLADGLYEYDDDEIDDSWADQRWKRHRRMRAVSEEVGEAMEI